MPNPTYSPVKYVAGLPPCVRVRSAASLALSQLLASYGVGLVGFFQTLTVELDPLP
jgi:hypothetical protein